MYLTRVVVFRHISKLTEKRVENTKHSAVFSLDELVNESPYEMKNNWCLFKAFSFWNIFFGLDVFDVFVLCKLGK